MSRNKSTAERTADVVSKTAKNQKIDRKMLIFISIFLSVILLSGAVLGAVFAIRNRNSALEYNGTRMSYGVANYFASYAKAIYLNQELSDVDGAVDTPEFWNSEAEGGKTYGEGLSEYVKNYLSAIVVGCYLYDSCTRLSSEAKATIRESAEGRLDFIAGGKESKFNETTLKFGFDYDDFYEATKMRYKAVMAPYVLYGADGSGLKYDTELQNEFYNLFYRRVKLLFIRTSSDFVLDENGNREKNEDGTDKIEDLDSEERALRLQDIESIKASIENIESGSDGQMSPSSFDFYLDKYKATNIEPMEEYFALGTDYTQRAEEENSELVDKAFGMEMGSYSWVNIAGLGICFLYRCELFPAAYTDTDENGPFSDFYQNLSRYKYNIDIESGRGAVNFLDKFFEIDLIALPENGTYTIGI